MLSTAEKDQYIQNVLVSNFQRIVKHNVHASIFDYDLKFARIFLRKALDLNLGKISQIYLT